MFTYKKHDSENNTNSPTSSKTPSPNSSCERVPSISLSISSEDECEFNEHLCCGHLRVFKVLPILAALCLPLDIAFAILTVNAPIGYAFMPSLLFTVIALLLSTRGVRKEKRTLVKVAAYVLVIKSLLVCFLLIGALVVFFNRDAFFDLAKIHLTNKVLVATLIIQAIHLPLLALQFYVTLQTIEIIRKRDEIYIIPSSHGSVQMRPSLALVIERLKNQDLGVQVF